MIIGITGRKQNGKDTCANHIVGAYGYTKYSLAQPLKEAVKTLFGFNEEQVNGSLKEVIDDRWKVTPRQIMQWVGTEVMQKFIGDCFPIYAEHIGRNHWVKLFEAFIKNNPNKNIVCADVRFPHESNFIKSQGGIIIRVVRTSMDSKIDLHPSEIEQEQIEENFTIYNDNTIDDLYEVVDSIMF